MFSILINLLLAVHVIVSLLIVLIVLMQRPKNEGLGAAFGGGMTENMFGAQTTNILAKFTRWLGGLFFLLSLSLSVLYARQSRENDALSQSLRTAPVPEAAATPMVSPSPGVPAPGVQAIPAEMFTPSPTPEEAQEVPAAAAPAPAEPAAPEASTVETPSPVVEPSPVQAPSPVVEPVVDPTP